MSDEILTPEAQTAAEEIAQILAVPVEPEISVEPEAPVAVGEIPAPPVAEVSQVQPVEKKREKKKLPLGVRIGLKVLTFILCIALTVSLTATLLVMDMNALVSKNTIRSAAEELLYVPAVEPRLSENPGETESLIVNLIYDAIYNREDNDLTVTKKDIAQFVDDGSISDFLVDKTASYAEDFIRGTQKTDITAKEVEDLLDDNEELIEEVFGITLDSQTRQDILGYIEENDIHDIVQEQIIDEAEKQPLLGADFTVGDALGYIRFLLSPVALAALIGLNLLLAAAIFFTKRMRLGGTVLTVGSHVFGVGLTGSVPLLVLWFIPDLLRSLGLEGAVLRVVDVFVGALVPIHLGFVILGAVLMVAGIVLKIVLRPKKALA